LQKAALKNITARQRDDWRARPENIRREMTAARIPTNLAAFNAALYTGEILTDPDSGHTYFADVKLFDTLQRAAMQQKIAQLEKRWPWVKTLTSTKSPHPHAFEPSRRGDKEAGAIVWLSQDRELHVKESVLPPGTLDRGQAARNTTALSKAAATPVAAKRCLTDGQAVSLKHAKTQAMRLGIAANPKAALALLDPESELNIRQDSEWLHRRPENRIPPSSAEKTLTQSRLDLAGITKAKRGRDYYSTSSSPAQAKTLAALLELDQPRLINLLASLVAERVGTWFNNHDTRTGDSALAIAIAAAVVAQKHLRDTWQPDANYFRAYSRTALLRVAAAGGSLTTDLTSLKKSELVTLVTKRPAGTWTPDKFPECAFLRSAEIKTRMAAEEARALRTPASRKNSPSRVRRRRP